MGGNREGPLKTCFSLLNEPFIQWPQGTWSPQIMVFFSIIAFLSEPTTHPLVCSKEPQDIHIPPGHGGSTAPRVLPPSLCAPCPGALGPEHRVLVLHTREHHLSNVFGECVHTHFYMPAHLLGGLTQGPWGLLSVSEEGLCTAT